LIIKATARVGIRQNPDYNGASHADAEARPIARSPKFSRV
jgi:hypothetical protein